METSSTNSGKEKVPENWNLIISIHKNGDKEDCTSYRGIALFDVAYKVLAKILKSRLDK